MTRWISNAFLTLALISGCAAQTVGRAPSGHAGVTMVAPGATVGPPAVAAPTFVELHAGMGMFCGRTETGALWCWGIGIAIPGEDALVDRSRPTLIAGLPPLAGFTLAGDHAIVAWDRDGSVAMVARDPFYRGDKTFAIHHELPVFAERPLIGQPMLAPKPRALKIISAAEHCVVTADRELWCTNLHWSSRSGTASFARMPVTAATAGTGPCTIDPSGHAVAYNNDQYVSYPVGPGGPILTPLGAQRIDALGTVTSVACWHVEEREDTYRIEACGVGTDGSLRCTEATEQRRLETLLDQRQAVGWFDGGYGMTCVARDDGQARCVSREKAPRLAPFLAPLVGLDARRGLAATSGAMCALGGDGVSRCWGELGNPALGDGSTMALPAPRHLAAYDGADLISSEGGITCVRTSPEALRCFGRLGSSRVEPTTVPLPEPIDAMVGGFPLCVRGTASRRWYCRDPFGSFFLGHGTGGFEALRDNRGRDVSATIRSIAPNSGLGLLAVTNKGAHYAFGFRSRRQPLRLTAVKRWGADIVSLPDHFSGIKADGSGLLVGQDGQLRTIAAQVSTIASPCYLTQGGELHCFTSASATDAIRVAERVTQLTTLRVALTTNGDVLVTPDRTKVSFEYRKVAGLPPMQAIGGTCGLSRERQVWCWGDRSETDEAYARYTPLAVEP